MRRSIRDEFLNAPNLITMFRIALIPVVCVFLHRAGPLESFIAACLLALAAISDFLDGYLARRRKLVSVLGKFLDPLADKLIVMATLVMMVPMGRIEAWICIVLLAREIAITGLRGIASTEGLVMAAKDSGRYKTAFQLVGILCLMIHYTYSIDFLFVSAAIDFHVVGLWLIYISLGFSIFSAAVYIRDFVRAVLAREAREAAEDAARAASAEGAR
jgi:CDP-diacylglycerol--glycerol-3-phosphate 3-phosphatidyltransferase